MAFFGAKKFTIYYHVIFIWSTHKPIDLAQLRKPSFGRTVGKLKPEVMIYILI